MNTKSFVSYAETSYSWRPVFFWDTDQLTTVVMETAQLVLSQFKNFLMQSTENWIKSIFIPTKNNQ